METTQIMITVISAIIGIWAVLSIIKAIFPPMPVTDTDTSKLEADIAALRYAIAQDIAMLRQDHSNTRLLITQMLGKYLSEKTAAIKNPDELTQLIVADALAREARARAYLITIMRAYGASLEEINLAVDVLEANKQEEKI
jgi:predicted DNA-binding protein